MPINIYVCSFIWTLAFYLIVCVHLQLNRALFILSPFFFVIIIIMLTFFRYSYEVTRFVFIFFFQLTSHTFSYIPSTSHHHSLLTAPVKKLSTFTSPSLHLASPYKNIHRSSDVLYHRRMTLVKLLIRRFVFSGQSVYIYIRSLVTWNHGSVADRYQSHHLVHFAHSKLYSTTWCVTFCCCYFSYHKLSLLLLCVLRCCKLNLNWTLFVAN